MQTHAAHIVWKKTGPANPDKTRKLHQMSFSIRLPIVRLKSHIEVWWKLSNKPEQTDCWQLFKTFLRSKADRLHSFILSHFRQFNLANTVGLVCQWMAPLEYWMIVVIFYRLLHMDDNAKPSGTFNRTQVQNDRRKNVSSIEWDYAINIGDQFID